MSRSQPNDRIPNPCTRWHEISLSRGRVALVDAKDFKMASQYKWSFDGRYAVRNFKNSDGTWQKRYLHRLIIGDLPENTETDHVNGDKLDNRRSNLRPATRSDNCHNTRTLRSNNKCGRKGVHFRSETKKWIAQIKLGKKNCNLGSFLTLGAAIQARAKAEKEFHGEFALNQ